LVAVEDCGRIINQSSVDQQMLGAMVMGIGNVLYEELNYEDGGQLQSGSLMDYLLPLAPDVPPLQIAHMSTLSDRTSLGSKGMGEAGTIGAVAAVGTAVADAVGQLGYELNDLPASPSRIFGIVGPIPTTPDS
jgi:carbon-monoxide dehydrogenase large subunit